MVWIGEVALGTWSVVWVGRGWTGWGVGGRRDGVLEPLEGRRKGEKEEGERGGGRLEMMMMVSRRRWGGGKKRR